MLVLLTLAPAGVVGCAGVATPDRWSTTFNDDAGLVLSSDAVADVSVSGGELRVHIFSPGQLAWASTKSEWEDCRVSVLARQVSGPVDNEYGVLLRMEDDATFYAFSVSADGYVRAARYADAAWSLLSADWTPSDAVNQGAATNKLEVVAVGSLFEFLVNDQSLFEVRADAPSAGAVGLYAGAFSEGDVVVAFDDLSVVPAP